jgi:hypothetical protein
MDTNTHQYIELKPLQKTSKQLVAKLTKVINKNTRLIYKPKPTSFGRKYNKIYNFNLVEDTLTVKIDCYQKGTYISSEKYLFTIKHKTIEHTVPSDDEVKQALLSQGYDIDLIEKLLTARG